MKSRVENCIRRLYRKPVEDDIDTVQKQIQNIEKRDSMTKKYPSQKKYEDENPAITIRLKKREKEWIREMAEKAEKSVSELVRMALLDLEKDFCDATVASYDEGFEDGFNKGYEEGNTKGYEKGMNDWAIWVYCWRCRNAFYIKPNSDQYKKLIEVTDGYMEHSQCPKN